MQQAKGFVPYAEVDELAQNVPPPIFAHDFMGIRSYWGSLMSLAVIRGETVNDHEVPSQAEAFYRFVSALRPFAGSLQVRHGGFDAGTVQLGSFGLICYVFEAGCRPQTAEKICSCRHGSLKNKDYVRCWTLDGHDQRVIAHRWLPLTMFPGKRYLRSLLA